MTMSEILVSIAIGVVATLMASGLIWFFRRQLRQALAVLDMSTGAVLAWLMAFIMLAVMIVFPLMDIEIPAALVGVFAFIIGSLMITTVFKKMGK